jgi:hypothetical protein
MPRHDKVKINRENGQTGGKKSQQYLCTDSFPLACLIFSVKIYVAAVVHELRINERQDETQFTTEIGGKTSLGPSYFFL